MAFLGLTTCALANAQTNTAPASSALATNTAMPTTTPTQTDPFDDPLIKQVQARHEKAVKGDTKETKALTADLEKWTQEQPTNYLLQAYLGSVYTLASRDAWPGPGKLTYLRNGGKWLDGAVAAAPDNPAVRFVRAINYYELPFFFGKGKIARDDFQILLKQIDGEVKTPYVLNTETQQAIYYYAGLSFKQLAQMPQAKDAWMRGYKLSATSDLGKKIGDELMKVPDSVPSLDAEQPMAFAHLKDALSFIDQKLDAEDWNGLSAALYPPMQPNQPNRTGWQQLKSERGQKKLVDVLSDKEFPSSGDDFLIGASNQIGAKLSGYSKIKFKRTETGWHLNAIYGTR